MYIYIYIYIYIYAHICGVLNVMDTRVRHKQRQQIYVCVYIWVCVWVNVWMLCICVCVHGHIVFFFRKRLLYITWSFYHHCIVILKHWVHHIPVIVYMYCCYHVYMYIFLLCIVLIHVHIHVHVYVYMVFFIRFSSIITTEQYNWYGIFIHKSLLVTFRRDWNQRKGR